MGRKGIVSVPGELAPESLTGVVRRWESVEDQLAWLSNYELQDPKGEEVKFVFNLFTAGLNHSLRKQFVKALNGVFEKHPEDQSLENYIFSEFLAVPREEYVGRWLSLLTVCVDGPDNCVSTSKFEEWISIRSEPVLATLVKLLQGWAGRNQTELLMIARLIQSVLAKVPQSINNPDLSETLIEILGNNHDDSSRDLTTVAGYLLCTVCPDSRFDRPSWRPLPRMSIRRAIVALEEEFNFSECLTFYASFLSHEASAMDLHYAVQSIHLLLSKLPPGAMENTEDGLRITQICLARWDHTLHMVAANCRALFGQLCSRASPTLLAAIARRAGTLEAKTKKKFNLYFGLVPYMTVEELISDSLIEEVMDSLRRWSPCVTAAGGLLEVILMKADLSMIESIVRRTFSDQTDWDQLLGAFLKASKVRKDGVSPFALLITELTASGNEFSILRALQSGVEFSVDESSFFVDKKPFLEIQKLRTLVLSSDPSVVALAVSVVARGLLVNPVESLWELLESFLTRGGAETVTGSKDDRSQVLQELKKLFDKSFPPKTIERMAAAFEVLWKRALRENALQEECLLQIELMAALRPGRLETLMSNQDDRDELVRQLVKNGLTSRWRKVRSCSRTVWNNLGKSFSSVSFSNEAENLLLRGDTETQVSEELAGVLFEFIDFDETMISSLSIQRPNINLLIGLASAGTCKSVDLIPHLLATIVFHSQFVGENSLDTIFLHSSDFLASFRDEIMDNRFTGSVDCRGHPIMGSDEESTRISVYAWTCAKAASLALKVILTNEKPSNIAVISKLLAILLLSVKHPAEIAPLESVFSAALKCMTNQQVDEELLLPLIGAVAAGNPAESVFPLPQALRRSQGLGPLISSIVRSQNSMSVISAVTERLLSVINLADTEDDQVLHSMNILRSMVRDSSIPDELMDGVLGDIMLSAIDILFRLSGEFWRIRSSATQLFVQAARRFVGADNEEDWFEESVSARKKISAIDFFFNRTKAGERLLAELVAVLSNSESEVVLVPIFSVLQSLANLGEIARFPDGEVLISTVRKAVGNKSAHVRRLASKIAARLDINGEFIPLFEIPPTADWNRVHGMLMKYSYLVRVGREINFSLTGLLEDSNIPQLIYNEAALISVYTNQPIAVEARYNRWILSLDEADIERSEVLAKAVVRAVDIAHDPVGRELTVAAIIAYPHLVDSERRIELLNLWLTQEFNLGIAVMVNLLGEEANSPQVTSWLESIDLLSENHGSELKSIIAKSWIVRTKFPNMHALLCLDESAFVRHSAAVDGMNCLVSFESVARKCQDAFLEELVNESLDSQPSDSILEYCLRSQAREICRNVLKSRNIVS